MSRKTFRCGHRVQGNKRYYVSRGRRRIRCRKCSNDYMRKYMAERRSSSSRAGGRVPATGVARRQRRRAATA